ncbi:MAG: DUF4340 domain-containing protein [Isosphaeraceae bacterium]
MKELWKTLTFVAVAILLTGAAFVSTRDRRNVSATFNDQGQPFFADFKDPLACTDLEVVSFDPSTATASRFRVMFKDKKWVIPSHYDYPADAKDRLSKTAAAVVDLARDTIRSDASEDQEAMGVIDPLDSKVSTLQGRGKRVTLRDASEKVLADLIIGNEIRGSERKEGGAAQRYVRVPGQKRIYGVNVKADLTTRFADWIETNLLKVESSHIRKIVFDNYKIQEGRDEVGRPILQVERGELSTIERKDSTGPWTMAGLPAGQELVEDRLRTLTDALGDLKIAGIRPKPAGLKDPNQKGLKLTPVVMLSLQSKGFFLTQKGLYSDQGDVIVSTDEGVVYTLRYGGPVFGSGDELTAGQPDDAEKKEAPKSKDAKKEAPKKDFSTQENRYLLVTVAFDPTLIAKPESMQEKKPSSTPTGLVNIPDKPFAPDPNDPKHQAEEKEAKEKADREKADYEKKLADGKKKVAELADRFGPWYYVTPGDSFRSINLDRAALTQPKKPPGAPGSPSDAGPGNNPIFNPGSLPPAGH